MLYYIEYGFCTCTDYRALGVIASDPVAWVLVSLILPVRGKGVRRRALAMHISSWLWSLCWQQGFGFYNHGTLFAGSAWERWDPPH